MIVRKNDSYLLKLIGFSKCVNFNEKKTARENVAIKRIESRISVTIK